MERRSIRRLTWEEWQAIPEERKTTFAVPSAPYGLYGNAASDWYDKTEQEAIQDAAKRLPKEADAELAKLMWHSFPEGSFEFEERAVGLALVPPAINQRLKKMALSGQWDDFSNGVDALNDAQLERFLEYMWGVFK